MAANRFMRPRMLWPFVAVIAVTGALFIAVPQLVNNDSEPIAPTPISSAAPAKTNTLDESSSAANTLRVLETIPVKGRAPKTGYARSEFGSPWIDVDRNGCDTRNDILARDLTEQVVDDSCRVLTGVLLDPYTGQVIDFVRGEQTSQAVQIDHVVALLNAWETGAQQLTYDDRVELANDPLNLLAVDGPTNSRKGSGDAATWLPPQKSFRCEYVTRQVLVKAKYQLWVTRAERDAIVRVLSACP